MTIGVLAWGSVIWDPRELPIEGSFSPDGPELPLEFSRVSGDRRLTLIVDEEFGSSCTTYSALSVFDDLDQSLIALWKREGSKGERPPVSVRNSGRVGFVDVGSGAGSPEAVKRHPTAVETIRKWGLEHQHDFVIWTSLGANFHERTGSGFSVDAALGHLDGQDKLSFARSLNYIWRAPPQVQTPLRAAVNECWPLRGRQHAQV